MAFQDLSQFEILEGILGLIWVVIAFLIGIRIIIKALSEKRELIPVGLTYITISSAWWGVAFQFVFYGFFDIYLNQFTYLFVANVFIPVALICWAYSFSMMVNPDIKKKVLAVYIPFAIIYEIVLLTFLFTDPNLVATIDGTFNSTHSSEMRIFIILSVLSFVVLGLIFAVKSMRIDDLEVKWKGRFLLIAWISFAFGAIADSSISEMTTTLLIFIRIIMITSAFEFYLGFFLPEKIANWLIKE